VLPHIRQVAEHYTAELSAQDLPGPFTGLARVAEHRGAFGEALGWSEQARKECEERLGPSHPSTSIALNNLALLLQATNRLAEAEPLMRRALAIDEASYGTDHPRVATRLNNLASLLKATNRLAEAEPLMRRVVAIFIAFSQQGYQHPHLEAAFGNYYSLLKDMNLPESEIEAKLQSLLPPSA
jgi:tetratricopeptide (TPR) repeat protein